MLREKIDLVEASSHVVMGKKLNYLSIGHLEALSLVDSPILYNSNPSPIALVDAVAILAVPQDVANNNVAKGMKWRGLTTKKRGRIFLEGVRLWVSRQAINYVVDSQDVFNDELENLICYLASNWNPPEIKWDTGGKEINGVPDLDHLKLFLRGKGISDPDEFHVSEALWLREAENERVTGERRVKTEEDKRAEEIMRRSEERYLREQKIKEGQNGKL